MVRLKKNLIKKLFFYYTSLNSAYFNNNKLIGDIYS